MSKLSHDFYSRNTLTVARELLGKYLVRSRNGVSVICRIAETEAYIGSMDKACHAYGYHRTPRTSVMFGPPGHAYVYLVYGMYHCLNFVTEREGEPCAVLIRSLECVSGLELLSRIRYGKLPDALNAYERKNLLNGPGKLCLALAVTRELNGEDLMGDRLFVCESAAELGVAQTDASDPRPIQVGKRIGIGYAEEAIDFPFRFYY